VSIGEQSLTYLKLGIKQYPARPQAKVKALDEKDKQHFSEEQHEEVLGLHEQLHTKTKKKDMDVKEVWFAVCSCKSGPTTTTLTTYIRHTHHRRHTHNTHTTGDTHTAGITHAAADIHHWCHTHTAPTSPTQPPVNTTDTCWRHTNR
jgi:hypothetical protein